MYNSFCPPIYFLKTIFRKSITVITGFNLEKHAHGVIRTLSRTNSIELTRRSAYHVVGLWYYGGLWFFNVFIFLQFHRTVKYIFRYLFIFYQICSEIAVDLVLSTGMTWIRIKRNNLSWLNFYLNFAGIQRLKDPKFSPLCHAFYYRTLNRSTG